MMQIIPVIDLLNGVVVHAKRGERQHYQPIQSQLTASSTPLDIVSALLEFYPFTQLYIADLNAIQKLGGVYSTNYQVIESISQRFPTLDLWVDAGISNNNELSFWQTLDARLVIGSENFANMGSYCALNHLEKNFILSLDFFPHGYQGPDELLDDTAYWPQDVIIMCLASVGTNQGVDENLMNKLITLASGKNVYAAGGIRHIEDLMLLKKMDTNGALIATALHNKQLSAEDIKNLN